MYTGIIHIKIFFLQSMLKPASAQADKIFRLFKTFNIAAAAMLLLVIFLVTYISIKYKERKDETREPKQTHGNKKLEALMIGVPMLLLTYFFYETIRVQKAIAPSVNTSQRPDVIITGHQWWWEIEYPASGVITANEVHLPVGKHLLLEMRSADVIHDWWVPELGNKMDLIPNVSNYLQLDINKPGRYTGTCSEFCGAQHAWMRINVVAQTQFDFDNWLTANATNATEANDTISRAGARLFQEKTCSNCHRIQGTTANAAVGPDLTHMGSRQEILTGLMKNNEENLYKWINNPQEIKPGAHMPDFILDKDSVEAIAYYLSGLK